jgi:hypothetical protein
MSSPMAKTRRRQVLARYFEYSMSEEGRMGRLVVRPEPCKLGLKSRSRVLRKALDPTQ